MPDSAARLLLLLVAVAGVVLAVAGLLRLSLAAMAAGAALWLLGGYLWERLSTGYRP